MQLEAKNLDLRLIDEGEAAELLGLNQHTLKMWRLAKEGPPYIKMGKRIVRYSVEDLMQWCGSNRIDNTQYKEVA